MFIQVAVTIDEKTYIIDVYPEQLLVKMKYKNLTKPSFMKSFPRGYTTGEVISFIEKTVKVKLQPEQKDYLVRLIDTLH